jgi:hypothetical protein
MTDAKRRLTDIKFEHEGAHVALVGKHQGGPANGITTLVFKATDHIEPAKVALALAGQSAEQPTTIIEEPIVEQIEKSVHETLLATAVTEAVAVEKAAAVAVVEEIQKALDAQAEVLKAAQEKVQAFEAAAVAQKQEVRKAALAAVLPAEQVEGVLKALDAVADEAFQAVVAGYAVQKAAVDNSDLLSETGVNGTGDADVKEVDRTTAILKAKYARTA